MPLDGNRLGRKSVYDYTDDTGKAISLLIDDNLAIVNSGLTLDSAGGPKPLRFHPRVVFAQAIIDGRVVRKTLICGTADSGLYKSNTSSAVQIDGRTFYTTGRRGEKLSFLSSGAQGDAGGAPAAPAAP